MSNDHANSDGTNRSPAAAQNGAVQLRVEAQDGLAVKTDSVDNVTWFEQIFFFLKLWN